MQTGGKWHEQSREVYLQHNFNVVSISFTFLVSLKPATTVQQRLSQTRLFRAWGKGIQGNFPRHFKRSFFER